MFVVVLSEASPFSPHLTPPSIHSSSLTPPSIQSSTLTPPLPPPLPFSLTPPLPSSLTPPLPSSLTPPLPSSLTPPLASPLPFSLRHCSEVRWLPLGVVSTTSVAVNSVTDSFNRAAATCKVMVSESCNGGWW